MKQQRQWRYGTFVLVGAVTATGLVWAAEVKESKAPAQPAAAEASAAPTRPAAAAPVPAAAPAVKPSPEKEVQAQLDGTKWTLELIPLSGDKTKTQKDALTFSGRQVTSEQLSKAGYGTTNYSVTIGGDGVAVWETMQTKEGEGLAFWRGELHGANMDGALSKQPVKGAPQDFAFSATEASGKSVKGSGQAAATAPGVSAAQASTAPAAGKEPPKKKKRKGR